MKLGTTRQDSGSVLATTLVMTFVLGTTLASFLMLTQHQMLSNTRSQSWNHTLAVTESGVEDALQMINKYSDDSRLILNWASDVRAGGLGADSWEYKGNDVYVGRREVGNPVRAVYELRVNNSRPNAPTILAKGILYYDHAYDHGTVGTVGTANQGYKRVELERTVFVTTQRDGLFTTAMLADVSIDLNGNNISTDSFNSADPAASYWAPGATYGIYDPRYRSDHGDVACNSNLEDSFNSGNADIRGHVSTGPGGAVHIGANGSVGSASWVDGGNSGIQEGYVSDDMNVRLDPVEEPAYAWTTPIDYTGAEKVIDGVPYRYVIEMSGNYSLPTLSGNMYVASNVTANLLITGDVNMSVDDRVQLDPNCGGLSLYMKGARFKSAGEGFANPTGDASRFLYFGLPTNTEIKFAGNASFTGAIYAPQADFMMGGGGEDIQDFIGSCVARTIKMNGHYNFHYDENLATYGPSRGFVPTTWREL